MFKIKVKAKYNYKKMENLSDTIIKGTTMGIEEILNQTKALALRLKKGADNGILVELIETSTKLIKGRVYTDKHTFSDAMFVEFGTGEHAELDHIGTTKTFLESGYEYWLLPVHKVEKKLHYPIIQIAGNQFYVARGVKSRPFMRPAAFEMKEKSGKILYNSISEMIKETLK